MQFSFMSTALRVVAALRKHRKRTTVFIIAAIVTVVGLFYFFESPESQVSQEDVKTVAVASVASLSGASGSLVLVGEVRAASQVDLRAEVAGQVTAVRTKLGSAVRAGAVLVEIENAAERARVLSAQGALASAEAQYALVLSGARSQERAAASVAAESAQGALGQARRSAENALIQAFGSAQDAIEGKIDNFFRNTETVRPLLLPPTKTYETSLALERTRASYLVLFDTWAEEPTQGLSDEELEAALTRNEDRLRDIKTFLNNLARVVALQTERGVPQDTVKADLIIVNAAQAQVDSALAGVAAARIALLNARAAAQVATAQNDVTVIGPRDEEVRAAAAGVTQARGALALAQADLERTVVRTPISGTVSSLSVRLGDYVSAPRTVAVVTNEKRDGYLIETFVAASDRSFIAPGNLVSVEGGATGTVTSVAPGVDPVTQKVRVDITVNDSGAALVPGTTVRLSIVTDVRDEGIHAKALTLPLSALKLTPSGAFVFVVLDNGTLEARSVTLGPLLGERVIVRAGLSPEIQIVTDARGKRAGQRVSVMQRHE